MSAIGDLARKMGLEATFKNAAGEVQHTSEQVERGVLAAMGIRARNAGEARDVLDGIARAEWSRPLPPVVVVRDTGLPARIPLTLPPEAGAVHWSLREEAGGLRTGKVRFRDLDPAAPDGLDGAPRERRHLRIDGPLPLGYHRLRVEADGTDPAEMTLIVAPERCYLPPDLSAGRPIWGISIQLYLLRSDTNWGIGDFTDLRNLVGIAADLGASAIGLNPLHAMFPDRPEHASPYSPASRLFLNTLYIDVTAVPEFAQDDAARGMVAAPAFQRDLAACREASSVDYEAVTRLKLPVLERLWQAFREDGDPERREAFAAYRREQGKALERFCRFLALREHHARGRIDGADYRHWPAELRDPDSAAVDRFAAGHEDRVAFAAWLQWIADGQLADAAGTARRRGMSIGLYRDLAVGADSAGAETWARPGVVVAGAHAGAPPDLFNPAGQDWGLPPFHPRSLRDDAYAAFVELVRANMRHAGGLRIDHVMALQHLYWVPAGRPPTEGAYVSYPLDDLVGILALESHRQRCLVVGEDLGTVPEGFRERMAEAAILSYRVVFFEYDEEGGFLAPEAYPALSLATIGSHDLATLRGWWEARDIDLKERHGLYPDPGEADRQHRRRQQDRAALAAALAAAGIALPAGFGPDAPYGPEISAAVHAFLARTGAGLAMVQLDDLTDEADQVNLPATSDRQHPNWRRKLSLPIEGIAADPAVRKITDLLDNARPRPAARPGRKKS